MNWFKAAIVTAILGIILIKGGAYLHSISDIGKLDQQVHENNKQVKAKWEADACRKALPEAKAPKPIWRTCSPFEKCFHCVDDRGVLHPVRPPHCGPQQSCQ